MKYAAVITVIVILIAFGIGVLAAPVLFQYPQNEIRDDNDYVLGTIDNIENPLQEQVQISEPSKEGLIPINVTIVGNTVALANQCNAIVFDVTDDQAFSIAAGISRVIEERPLTHDLFRDVLDNFGVSVIQIQIDRYEDQIYKADIFLEQGDNMLQIDSRPSDAIALAVRLNKTIYIDQKIMQNKSVKIC